MPQTRSPQARALLKAEYLRFLRDLETRSGKAIDHKALSEAINRVNAKRAAMARLSTLAGARPIPISGLDVLLINQIFFYDDPARFTDSVNRVCDELEERTAGGRGVARPDAPRLVFSGCPFAVPNWKLHSIVEAAGAAIVGLESCVGERGARNLVDVSGQSVDRLLDSLVDRYLSINCAVFTPNPGRLDHVRRMVSEYGADGVVHYALQFCGPYQIEAGLFERQLEKDGIPVLRVDTDYGSQDQEQLRTRVEAFLERLQGL